MNCSKVGEFASVCGSFGTCVGSVCQCDDGWSQSSEFSFFLDDRFDVDENVLVCDRHLTLLRFLYGTIVVLGLFTMLGHLLFVRRWKQVKRLMFMLGACAFYITASVFKLVDEDNSFGENIYVTFFFSFGIFLANCTSLVFFNKYLYFQNKMISFSESTDKLVEWLKRVQIGVSLVDFTCSCLIFATIFVEGSESQILINTAFVLQSLRSMYAIGACYFLIQRIIKDLNRFHSSEYGKVISQKRRTLRHVRAAVVCYNAMQILFFSSAVFSNRFLNMWKYFMPCICIGSGIMVLVVLVKYQEDKIKKFALKTTYTKPGTHKGSTRQSALEESPKNYEVIPSVVGVGGI